MQSFANLHVLLILNQVVINYIINQLGLYQLHY